MNRLLTLLAFSLSIQAQAQHVSLWTRGTLQLPVNERWSTDAEVQLRRQNGLNNYNPMQEHSLYSYRHWVYYRLNEGVRFAVSPFAYYKAYSMIQEPADYGKKPASEYRLTAAVDLQHNITGSLYIIDRSAIEGRMFNDNTDVLRVRNRLGLRYDLHHNWKFYTYHEVFLNTAGTHIHHFFDHDRLSLGASVKLASHWQVDMAVLHISRLDRQKAEKLEEEALMLNISYKLDFHKHI